MSILDLLDDVSVESGCVWNESSKNHVLADYIEKNCNREDFEKYLRERAEKEAAGYTWHE